MQDKLVYKKSGITLKDMESYLDDLIKAKKQKQGVVWAGKGFIECCVKQNGLESTLWSIGLGFIIPVGEEAEQYVEELKNKNQFWRP